MENETRAIRSITDGDYKITLEFSLPTHQWELDCCMNGVKLQGAAEEFDNWLRGKLKHEDLDDATFDAYEKAREVFWEYFSGLLND